jgi:MFS family permease
MIVIDLAVCGPFWQGSPMTTTPDPFGATLGERIVAVETAAVPDPTPTASFREIARPRRGFSLFLMLAMIGAGAALMSSVLLTLTLKATQLDAAAATTTISISSAVAGVFTLVALPAFGALSDGSRSRFGRRRPYLLLGAALFALGGLTLVLAPNVPVFVLAHLLIISGHISTSVAVTALIPDQLPANRRGPATALTSIGTPVGALIGLAVSVPFGDRLGALVGIPVGFAVLTILLLVVVVRDPKWELPRSRFDVRGFIGIFWVNPLRHTNFTMVFASRMLVFSGVAALNGYQAIFMLQKLHLDPAGLGTAILLTVVVTTGATLLVAPAIGRVSDRIGRRKPFILAAAIILAVGLVVAANATDLPSYLVACGIVGVGQGVYFAVELVLATTVLPDPNNPAKDLGILKVADNLPTTVVAALAPALLAIGASAAGPNFASLFVAGAIAATIGGFAILFVRGAR